MKYWHKRIRQKENDKMLCFGMFYTFAMRYNMEQVRPSYWYTIKLIIHNNNFISCPLWTVWFVALEKVILIFLCHAVFDIRKEQFDFLPKVIHLVVSWKKKINKKQEKYTSNRGNNCFVSSKERCRYAYVPGALPLLFKL